MNPLSFLSKKSLTPSWSYSPEGTIWRILFGEVDHIVGECRDQEKKTVTFFCIDGRSGKPHWEGKRVKEPWWTGIEAVHRDVVLVHGFEQPDMPGHRGIDAWNLETGEEIWRNEETTFWFCYGERVYSYRTLFERRVGYALDLHTGSVVETFEKGIEELFPVRKLAVEEAGEGRLQFPEPVQEGRLPDELQSLIEHETGKKEVAGGVEYLIADPYLIMNYHVQSRNSTPESLKLENHLAIIDMKLHARVFADVVAKESTVPVPDSFFVRDGFLYFVKDQRTLHALELPGLNDEVSS